MYLQKFFWGVFFLFSLSLSLSCLTKIICSNIIYVNTTIVLRDIYRRTSSLSFVSLFLEKLSEQRGVAVIVILRGIRAAVDRVSSSLQVCADLGNQHVGNLFVRKFLQQSFHLRLSTSDDIYWSVRVYFDRVGSFVHLEHSRVFDHFKGDWTCRSIGRDESFHDRFAESALRLCLANVKRFCAMMVESLV